MIRKIVFYLFSVIFFLGGLVLHAQDYYMYTGTYTLGDGGGEGIYLCRFSADDGSITFQSVIKGVENPSFLITDRDQTHLYAVSEMVSGKEHQGGAAAAFSVHRSTGDLTLLNQSPTGGGGPCHLALDHSGKWLFTANYGGGSITVFPVLPDGRTGAYTDLVKHYGNSINPQRQSRPHVHEVVMDPSGDLLYVPDLGLDKVFIYRVNTQSGKLTPWSVPFLDVTPGSGPRHMVFSPDGKYMYVLQEMGSGITVFQVTEDRKVFKKIQQISLLPAGADKTGNTGAELQITRDGKYLYASNRGHNSIALFRTGADGHLVAGGDFSCGGKTPRFFTLDPTEKFLLVLNQDSGNIVVFKRKENGSLERNGTGIDIPKPVCALFIPVK